MVVSETYTQGNLNPSAREAVTLYGSREPTAEEVSYINQHTFDNASANGLQNAGDCRQHHYSRESLSGVDSMVQPKS